MNVYGVIILTALLVDYILGLISDYLNLKAMKDQVPDEFKDVFDAEAYQKSQAYTRETTRFGLVSGSVGLVATLAFWFLGGFNWLDQLVRSIGFDPTVSGIVFIGSLLVLKFFLSLPFSLYSTFVIEEKYGFNKTTPALFVTDMFKTLSIAALLGIPLLAVVLWFFQSTGSLAWLYVWGIVTAFTLLLQYIAPTWIMPLFNKFSPLENEELKARIMDYANTVKFGLQDIFMMDGSKRSTKSNAFFTGFGRNKRIALFDTLLNHHTQDEIVAVVAHEIGHYKKKHIVKNMVTSIAHTGVVLFLLSIFLTHEGLFDAFYMEEMSIYAGLIFFGLLYQPVEMILSVVMSIQSRKHEFEADAFAFETTGMAEPLADALKKLSRNNLSNLTPHPFHVWMHYSHPPVLERIQTLRAMAKG